MNICANFGVDLFSRYWEVENMSTNQRPERPNWISDRLKK